MDLHEVNFARPPITGLESAHVDAIDTSLLPSTSRSFRNGSQLEKVRSLYLDLTDLIEYATHNVTLSGIQRVVASVFAHAKQWGQRHPEYVIVPVIPEYDRFRIFAVEWAHVERMISTFEEKGGHHSDAKYAIEAIYNSRREAHPQRHDLFIVAGAFWIYCHYDLIKNLRARGVIFGLFIHDLIQIQNPEFVHAQATSVFRLSLIDALSIADFVLTNSNFVAAEVTKFLESRMNFSLPTRAVPLATELRAIAPNPESLRSDILAIGRSDYVLCVGTIEVRKNHLLLVKIWERLLREFHGEVPDLVFVGKWGWDIDPLREHIDRSSLLGGKLRVVNDASDAALVHLYRNCLFTTYVSFAEGFGLPVAESCSYGKPCVAANTTSLPEVGGRFARYIDPLDVDDGYRVFSELLSDRSEITRWAQLIRNEYKPRKWSVFTNEFFDACVALGGRTSEDRRPNNCRLLSGQTYFIGDEEVRSRSESGDSLATFRMARDSSWHPTEVWGCWASEREATLRFATDLEPGSGVRVAVLAHAPPGGAQPRFRMEIGGVRGAAKRLSATAGWFLAYGRISGKGELEIRFHCEGTFGRPDSRILYIGVHALAFYRSGDLLNRRRFGWLAATSSIRGIGSGWFAGSRAAAGSQERRGLENSALSAEASAEMSPDAASTTVRYLKPICEIGGPMYLAFPAIGALDTPAEKYMTAANCVARDFFAEEFGEFCLRIATRPELHRQLWEFAFIAHHLSRTGKTVAGSTGVGPREGAGPLPSYFAGLGCDIQYEEEEDFVETPAAIAEAPRPRRDFYWSASRIQKLGSIDRAIDFVIDRVESRLRPGGVAAFTGDFNFSSDQQTIETGEAVLFRRSDIKRLAMLLRQRGHGVTALPFEASLAPIDCLVDMAPYGGKIHLKAMSGKYVATSFGIVVTRGEDDRAAAGTSAANR